LSTSSTARRTLPAFCAVNPGEFKTVYEAGERREERSTVLALTVEEEEEEEEEEERIPRRVGRRLCNA